MKIVTLLIGLVPAVAFALEVNTASRAQLEQLAGLGVVTVERILRERGERPFADWNDLAARVAGLRGKRAEQLARQGMTVGGKPLPTARESRQ